MKVILFILSLHLDVQKPFLVISTSTALSVWEAEFLHLAPSANIVVYYGNRDVRSSIRSLEFYNEGGGIMFSVLLSSADVVVEVLLFYIIVLCLQVMSVQINKLKFSRTESIFLDELLCDYQFLTLLLSLSLSLSLSAIDAVFKVEIGCVYSGFSNCRSGAKELKVPCSFVLYFDMQDLRVLECIEWEAIIIDKCQRSKMSKHFEQIRMLAANMRLLLISGQIKVRISITNIFCYASSN